MDGHNLECNNTREVLAVCRSPCLRSFFLADSQSLAGGSVDTTVIVWVTPTCRHLAGLLGAGVFCLPFHAAGEREQEFARHPDPVFR